MWNKPQMYEEDDSWEIRAFEEDTLGCTWPPRSYTCTFCKREFRSAQALGGHMNVHRRDRARLHGMTPQVPPLLPSLNVSKRHPSSSAFIIPTQEFVTNGLCLLYQFPNPNPNPNSSSNTIIPNTTTTTMDSPNHQLFGSFSLPLVVNGSPTAAASSLQQSGSSELGSNDGYKETAKDSPAIEELDLELRLGRRSPPPC